MNIGFSTGSVAKSDFRKALALMSEIRSSVIELSALRENELEPLIESLQDLDLSQFHYKSFHAPSKLVNLGEADFVNRLSLVAEMGWHIIVHPDVIQDFRLWEILGDRLCLENMDKRKPIGRTAIDMSTLFEKLPLATFCLDIAHARQVDPTLREASKMISQFSDRLVQIHISEVNAQSIHQCITFESILAFSTVLCNIPKDTPIVVESPTDNLEKMKNEIEKVKIIFNPRALLKKISPFKNSSFFFSEKVSELKELVKAS